MKKTVKILGSKYVLDDFFKVEAVELQFERFDGTISKPVKRLDFERGDSVAAILWNSQQQKVVLIRQFRYSVFKRTQDGWITEIIAGKLEKGEEPAIGIEREIEEETGYKVKTLNLISSFFVSPGGTSERIFLFYAEVTDADKVAAGGGVVSESEDIELCLMSWNEVETLMNQDKINDAKTLIALMYLQNKLGLK